MPFNIYSFVIGLSLAENEFNKRNVTSDRPRQLALLGSLFSPADGGGMGAAVFPALIIQQVASREAEDAAANAPPVLSTAGGQTRDDNVQYGAGGTDQSTDKTGTGTGGGGTGGTSGSGGAGGTGTTSGTGGASGTGGTSGTGLSTGTGGSTTTGGTDKQSGSGGSTVTGGG
jgi:hypothetical protein